MWFVWLLLFMFIGGMVAGVPGIFLGMGLSVLVALNGKKRG